MTERVHIAVARTRDRARLTLTEAGAAAELTAEELTDLIGRLAAARADIMPIVPIKLDDGASQFYENQFVYRVVGTLDGQAILLLRHAGLGWLGFAISAEDAGGVAAAVKYAAAQKPLGNA